MIVTVKNLREKLDEFNSKNKYLTNCEYCHNQVIYTDDKLRDNINIKCPYCGHMQKVFYRNKYNMKLKLVNPNCFDDDFYKV